MIPLAWKEIRENAKWAILGLIGVSIAMTYTLGSENSRYSYMGPEGLVSTQFQMVTIFGSAIAGALLGLLQIIPESVRDQWSFLLHRPAIRSRLFWGKVIGGLILYFAVMGLPLLGAALWISRPGHLAAPFDWRMVLPGVADILAGTTLYFAGLLVALRPARWYSTRALPIVTAALAMGLVVALPEFWHALLVIIIAELLLGTAAWASFVAGGEYQPQPRPAKAALGIILLTGIFISAGLLLGMMEAVSATPSFNYSQYFIDRDGRVLIVNTGESQTTVTDLQGRPVDEFKDPAIAAQYYNRSLQTSVLLYDSKWYINYRHTQRFCFRVYYNEQEAWYFIPLANRFEGFRIHDGHSLGWIGPNGYRIECDQTEPFPSSLLLEGWGGQLYATLVSCTQSVFRVDFFKRTINILYKPPIGQAVFGACDVNVQSEDRTNKLMAIAIAIPNGIVLLDTSAKPLASLPYHYDTSQYGQIQIGTDKSGDRFFLWYSPSSWLGSRAAKMPSYVVEITSSGQERTRVTLPPLPTPQVPTPWLERFLPGLVPLVIYIVVGIICLVETLVGYTDDDLNWAYLKQRIESDPTTFSIAAVTLITLIVTAVVITQRITRRYAFSPRDRRFWTTAAIFVGPAALLTLLGLYDWPALVPCPTCKKHRRVDRTCCEKCGQPFPPQEIRPGDIYDSESPQNSNEPTHRATLTPEIAIPGS